jgi:hypothetical protein
MIRAVLDGITSPTVPATFLVNDIIVPSIMYPSSGGGNGNPMCPNYAGTSGFSPGPDCPEAYGEHGPWNFAQVGVVVGTSMNKLMYHFDEIQDPSWGWGVFYATDANSVDQRCRYLSSDDGWDCPGGWIDSGGGWTPNPSRGGAGAYPAGNPYANPDWGGGAGLQRESNSQSPDRARRAC